MLKNEQIDKFITKTYIFPSETKNYENKNIYTPLFQSRNIKLILIILFFIFIFPLNHQNNNNYFNQYANITKYINITNFTYYTNENKSIIKPLAIYHSNIYSISEKDNILKNPSNLDKIKNQIDLAKNHSIYGFGILYNWDVGGEIFNYPLDIILENKSLDIPFLLIYNNENSNKNKKKFIFNIIKYIFDKRYIRINKKPAIGIYNPQSITKLKNNVIVWRETLKELGMGEIFILSSCNEKNIDDLNKMNLFNAFFDLSSFNSIKPVNHKKIKYYFYFFLLYNNLDLNVTYNKTNCIVYRSSDIISQYPITFKSINIYSEYSPLKFYYLNKMIIDWTRNKYNYNRFIFINSFDNNYLEQKNNNIGYESLNYLSLATSDYIIKENKYNLSNLENNCLVAVQVHVFYVDLLDEVIDKINNIPVKFDLYITTDTEEKKFLIEEYIKNNTKANKYEILIVENRGRDILPLLVQFKSLINKYKYFCHIHTKKSGSNPAVGVNWKNYLYGNLLGDKEIISEILSDFENSDKLGFVFPPTYSEILSNTIEEMEINLKPLNELLKKIAPGMKAGKKINFPAGNMFWARSKAVYQIFSLNINQLCPKEPIQDEGTIMHAIERSWLFIVKLNGYNYKEILKYI